MGTLDDKTVPLKCPKCGYEMRESIGFLKTHDSTECPGCGVTIKLKTKPPEEAEKAINHFNNSIRRL